MILQYWWIGVIRSRNLPEMETSVVGIFRSLSLLESVSSSIGIMPIRGRPESESTGVKVVQRVSLSDPKTSRVVTGRSRLVLDDSWRLCVWKTPTNHGTNNNRNRFWTLGALQKAHHYLGFQTSTFHFKFPMRHHSIVKDTLLHHDKTCSIKLEL